MTKRFTGWHAMAVFVAFFGVVIAVNVTMAVLAVKTFGGTVVENSYVASQDYNRWLAAARRQQQLGWTIRPELDGSRRVKLGLNIQGADVSGFARHPLGRQPDIPLSFGKDLLSRQSLPPGRWAVHLVVRRGQDEARVIELLS